VLEPSTSIFLGGRRLGADVSAAADPNDAGAEPDPGRAGEVLLAVEDLRVWFPVGQGVLRRGKGVVKAVDGVSFEVFRGETLGLVGESGCGKTTTAHAILHLVTRTKGRIEFEGVDLSTLSRKELQRLRRRMQPIFQDPFASLNPKRTVARIVTEPLVIHKEGSTEERRARVEELLETVGLPPDAASRLPHAFSGGQRQRISIARAMALQPDLIIADEPVSALDVSIRAQILNLLADLQDEFLLTYVIIAHDLALVRQVTDRVAVMYLGRIVEMRRTEDVYKRPLHPYTVALLSSVPIPDTAAEAKRQRIILEGDVPSPADPPTGCRFHTRCWLRSKLGNPDICTSDDPELIPTGDSGAGGLVACHFSTEVSESTERRVTIESLTRSAGGDDAGRSGQE
jgi:oligopeptide/dipeptide ABC transporter ATP-binding protein